MLRRCHVTDREGARGETIGLGDLLLAADVWMPALAAAGSLALISVSVFGGAWDIAAMAAVGGFVASFIPAAFLALRGGGVCLTLPPRVICLMVIAGSLSALLALAAAPEAQLAGREGTSERGQTLSRNDIQIELLRDLVVNRQTYQTTIDSLIAEISAMKAQGSERADRILQSHAERTNELFEQNRKLDEELRRYRDRHPDTLPEPGPPNLPNRGSEGGPFNGEVIIPPATREVLERTEGGRSLLAQLPILGPVLGTLLGGSRRGEVRRVVQTLTEGGRVPARADLTALLADATDLEIARAELEALVDRGQARGVINTALAADIRRTIAEVVTQLRRDIPTDVRVALDRLRAALNAGRACDVSVTAPDFTGFATRTDKGRIIARVPEQALKECLRRFPPTD